MRGPIVLPRVVDAGPEGNSGVDGDAVVVVITRWPELPGETPEGAIETVLGRPGDLSVEAAKILVLQNVEEARNPEAVAEADAFGDEVPGRDEGGSGEDLRHLPLPTIDPEDARDHDDAVWVERTGTGGYRAWIAIADVSTYVTPGSAIDDEAKRRGCSVYLPDRAIPMLPRALSSNLCSLLPHVDRLCLCAQVDLDASGAVLGSRMIRGVMCSRAKLTYGGVALALGLTSEGKREPAADAMVDGLRVAHELSRILRARRMKRGALDFELPEAKVVLDPVTREPVDVARRAQDPGVKKAYQLIEELMLLGNETVAKWSGRPGDPDDLPRACAAGRAQARALWRHVRGARHRVRPRGRARPEAPRRLLEVVLRPPARAGALVAPASIDEAGDVRHHQHRALRPRVEGVPALHVAHPSVSRPASCTAAGATRCWPGTRRGAAARRAARNSPRRPWPPSLSERRAMEVERAIVDLYRTFLMRGRLGERFEGTVTAVVGSGVFVQLDSPFVDVLVRLEDMGMDRWEVDEDALRVVAARSGELVARGDRLLVEITDAAILRRTVYAKRVQLGREDAKARGPRAERPGRPGGKPTQGPKGKKQSGQRADARSGKGPHKGPGKKKGKRR